MKILIHIVASLLLTVGIAFSQCSDAGVCSIGHIPADIEQGKNNHIGVHYIFGYSTPEDEVSFHTMRIDGSLQLFDSIYLNWQLPFLAIQDGPAGTVSGIGDAILLVRYDVLNSIPDHHLGLHAGVKLATGDANKNDHLPQIYQPGLGTNDLLLGLSYGYRSFDIMLGYQLVENVRNDNTITRLKRGDDLIAQLSYTHQFRKFSLNGKILAIQRLEKSSVLDTGSDPQQFYTVPESDQLQVNIDAALFYKLNDAFSLKGQLVSALLSRDVNVDGLTRGITLALGGIYSF